MPSLHRPSQLSLRRVLATLLLIGLTLDLAGCARMTPSTRFSEHLHGALTAGQQHAGIHENQFIPVAEARASTFSVDVDTASSRQVRRFLAEGIQPPAEAVRIEELINDFDYDYPAPTGDWPFSLTTEFSDCPWNPEARLIHIGLKTREIADEPLRSRNLVFLLDVSDSMAAPDKLPLLRRAMKRLVENLREDDRVAIVVYAGAAGVVLEPTSGADPQTIMAALDRLQAGGSTKGGQGIELAYALARQNFEPGAINRVIVATDGDFNLGPASTRELERLIERERESGVFLSVLGLGAGIPKHPWMERLADKGKGNYAHLGSIAEARKVLVAEAGATLETVAKDATIQVVFDPAQIESYRLIGYDYRRPDPRDVVDDHADAYELAAGHSVTALYEVWMSDYADYPDRVARVALSYERPRGVRRREVSALVTNDGTKLADSSDDFRFAAAVAEFGMLLRDSPHRGTASWASVRELAEGALGQDPGNHRHEFLALIDQAEGLRRAGPASSTPRAKVGEPQPPTRVVSRPAW